MRVEDDHTSSADTYAEVKTCAYSLTGEPEEEPKNFRRVGRAIDLRTSYL
jgi:hypothetical protein